MDKTTDIKTDIVKFNSSLKRHFQKLAGRNYGAYLSKNYDKFIKESYDEILSELFGDFTPAVEKIPLCVVATKRYARNEQSTGLDADIIMIYKDIKGYQISDLMVKFREFLIDLGLRISVFSYDNDTLFDLAKENYGLKDALFLLRYVCGSKAIYKELKEIISRLKDYQKDEYLRYQYANLEPYDNINFLDLQPNPIMGYGGLDEIYRSDLMLSLIGENLKQSTLKYIDENEYSELALSIDDIISIKNSLDLCGGKNAVKFEYLSAISEIMQTKEKKSLDTDMLLAQRMLNSMHDIAIYSRFIAKMVYNEYFGIDTRQNSAIYGDFWVKDNVVYADFKAHKTPLKKIIKDLLILPDEELKFDISAIIYLKRFDSENADADACMGDFKKLFLKSNLYEIFKALLNSEILFYIIKPMSHTRYLSQLDGFSKYGVDDHSVLSLYHLENIKDDFVAGLYGALEQKEKVMLKLALLMHDVGKGTSSDHETLGANIFRSYAFRFGLGARETNLGVILIKNHTLMNMVARDEDIYNQRVIFGFISKLGEQKLLNMLYILTYCNVASATDKPINANFLRLLRELFEIGSKGFNETKLLDGATRRSKKEASIKRLPEFDALSEKEQKEIFKIPSTLFFIKYAPLDILRIAKLAQNEQIVIKNDENLDIEIITKTGTNIANLLDMLAKFDLAYMEFFELFDEKLFIKLEYNKRFKDDLSELEQNIKFELTSLAQILENKPEIAPSEINLDFEHSRLYAQLKINAKDQIGLMAYVMSVFEKFGVEITSAKCQTIKNRTRNLFLIQKGANLDEKYQQIMSKLISKGE